MVRVIQAYQLAPEDRVDLECWALFHPDPDTRLFLEEDGWLNRFQQEFCVVREVEHSARGVLVRFRGHPTQRFDPYELLPIKVEATQTSKTQKGCVQ